MTLADRFRAAAERLGRHKGAACTSGTSREYSNTWTIAMRWGPHRSARRLRNGVLFRPYRKRRRGGRWSPERMAAEGVTKLARWGKRKRRNRARGAFRSRRK